MMTLHFCTAPCMFSMDLLALSKSNASVYTFLTPALREERVIQTLVLGYPLSLVSKAAPYLASIFGGTFPPM